MKIAVVGAGISGLAAAYYLSRTHEVHVFEAEGRPGGHTNTVEVDGRAVDTGFIVYNDRTYPRFAALLDALGVETQPSTMSFSVRDETSGLEYNGTDLDRLFVQRRNLFRPSFLRMVRDILAFNKRAVRLLEEGKARGSLEAFLDEGGYSRAFRDWYILPMGAAVWSAPIEKTREMPAAFFIRFFKNHGMLSVNDRPQWRVLKGGSKSYLPALTKPFQERLRLDAPVDGVRRGAGTATVRSDGREETFDEVVLACHADQALRVLEDASWAERDILSRFPYQRNVAVLHTDETVLPKRRKAWAAWNYLVPASPRESVAVTYDMNILQTLDGPRTYCVSLNLEDKIAPDKVIRKILYHHPRFTTDGASAQERWAEISGRNRTHFCGAYWRWGFHEDGVASALRVCAALGVEA